MPGANRNAPPRTLLEALLKRVVEVARPKRVVLFGSAASANMTANSDLDLLIVMPEGVHRRRTAQMLYREFVDFGIAGDFVVVTEDDVKKYRDNVGMVIGPALDSGEVLYAA